MYNHNKNMERAEKIAVFYVETAICPFDQCELAVIEENEQFYDFHFYQTITEANWTIRVNKDFSELKYFTR